MEHALTPMQMASCIKVCQSMCSKLACLEQVVLLSSLHLHLIQQELKSHWVDQFLCMTAEPFCAMFKSAKLSALSSQLSHAVHAKKPKCSEATMYSKHRGQSVACILGLYAHCKCPVMLDVTDGEVHNLMLIDDMELYVWEALTPKQAYFKQAEHLKTMIQCFGRTSQNLRRMPLADLSDKQQVMMQKLKELRPPNTLLEQLDSVVPHMPEDQKFQSTYDIIMAWQQGTPSPLPLEISKMLT